MITSKIQRLDEDDLKQKKNQGSVQDEQAAMKALCKKSGRSAYYHKTRAKNPGRGVQGGTGKSAARTRGAHLKDFAQLGEYLLEGKDKENHKDGQDRVEDAFTLDNPTAEDFDILDAQGVRKAEKWMGESAARNTTIKNSAALHYVVALPPEETAKATPEFWRDYAKRMQAELGLEGHQTLCVVHNDTDHRHMHIVINRVHPVTNRAVSPFRDLYKIEALNRKVEQEYDLKIVPGRLVDPETGEPYTIEQLKDKNARPDKRPPRQGIKDFENRAKLKLKESKPFSTATSWQDLESRLKEHGYSVNWKGGGLELVETNLPTKNEKGQKQVTALKVSQIAGKGNGGGALVKRYGQTFTDYLETKNLGIDQHQLDQRRADDAKTEKNKSQQAGQKALSNFVEFLSSSKRYKEFHKLTEHFDKANFVDLHVEVTQIYEKNKDPKIWMADVGKHELFINSKTAKTSIELILKKRFEFDINAPVPEPEPEPESQPEPIYSPKPIEGQPFGAAAMPDPKVLPDISEEPKKVNKLDVAATAADLPEKAPKVALGQSGQAVSVDLQATDGGKAEHDLVAKMTELELKSALKATNQALTENKKAQMGNSEKARNERVLKEGMSEIRKQMKMRGLALPRDPAVFAKGKSKRRGAGIA